MIQRIFTLLFFISSFGLIGLCLPRLSCAEIKTLRVASYNVWGLPGLMLRHPERLERLPAAVNSLDADIVLIQEAFHAKARALATVPNFPYSAWGPSTKLGHFSSGLLILSRHPILETAQITYRDCGGFDCFANKGAQMARIIVPDLGIISVFNTHLNANDHAAVRARQADQLLQFVRDSSDGKPAIIGGDFNDDGTSIRHSAGNLFFIREAHATEATSDPKRNPFLGKGDRRRKIDHLFFMDGFRGSAQAPDTRVTWNILKNALLFDGKDVLSDHFGVISTVRLTPASALTAKSGSID